MRRGKFDPERWRRAQALAERGYAVTTAAKTLGMHHASLLYIARKMGFKWPGSQGKRLQEPAERVERMMRLAR